MLTSASIFGFIIRLLLVIGPGQRYCPNIVLALYMNILEEDRTLNESLAQDTRSLMNLRCILAHEIVPEYAIRRCD